MAVIKPVTADNSAERSVTVLGSTGSVGCNTIDLIRRSPERFRVDTLTGNNNVELLAQQAIEVGAALAVIADESRYQDLKSALAGTGIEAAAGRRALVEAAMRPTDWVMAAIVGAAGLAPTLEAVRRGAVVGLANKECLVSAGEFFCREVAGADARLIPVDSEHSAIYQVFDFERPERIEKIILTASGGPFRERTLDTLTEVTPAEAVAHPNWSMGAKISVDSATMMNKGLELIEAFHLFPVSSEQIDILVHPQSVIHSMVEYVDASVLAQLGTPDMRTPIAFALAWPDRMEAPSPRLKLEDIATLSFEAPDPVRFPALRLAREALDIGGSAPTVLNASNEIAVNAFLKNGLGFLDIAKVVEETMSRMPRQNLSSLEDVYAVDEDARRIATELTDAIIG
ncbi:MAG: 1-deoxy-D-xylulose-5-phosphate reductoisomerase [Rhodospirillales bacterium]|nr:1-deoxy-D-xylulose-5-phosphate reductoisomerase [Rhodospirillales bacterium]